MTKETQQRLEEIKAKRPVYEAVGHEEVQVLLDLVEDLIDDLSCYEMVVSRMLEHSYNQKAMAENVKQRINSIIKDGQRRAKK